MWLTGLIKNKAAKKIKGFFGAFLMILCFGAIFTLGVFLSVSIIPKLIAIIIQTIGTCVFMIPIIWGLNNFAQNNNKNNSEEKIKELEKEIRRIECSGFNLQEFRFIQKVGLLETDLKQTILNKQIIDTSHRGKLPKSSYNVEYLRVSTNKVTAIFGINLENIKCKYNNNSIHVYGIKPEMHGFRDYDSHREVAEIRKIYINGEGEKTETQIDNSNEANKTLLEKEEEMTQYYHDMLKEGVQTNFLNSTVVKLAEHFIKMILAPLNKEVLFIYDQIIQDVPQISDFITNEKTKKENELRLVKGI